MIPAQKLFEKVQQDSITTGVLATDYVWPDLVEICQRATLDYLIVDMEHGAHSTDVVAEVCATGRRLDFPVLIRPRSNDYATLRLAIDLGCCGFLLACVESAADMDVVRDAIQMPPRGRRRPGGLGNRWVGDFGYNSWSQIVEDHFLVMPQIETRRGLANVQEIARHEMTSIMAVGPYDLSAELGICGEMKSPLLKEALGTIRAAANTANKKMWMIGGNAAELVRDGWKFLCIGEPIWTMAAALKAKAEEARQTID